MGPRGSLGKEGGGDNGVPTVQQDSNQTAQGMVGLSKDLTRVDVQNQTANTSDTLDVCFSHTKHIISPINGVVDTSLVNLPNWFLPVSLML